MVLVYFIHVFFMPYIEKYILFCLNCTIFLKIYHQWILSAEWVWVIQSNMAEFGSHVTWRGDVAPSPGPRIDQWEDSVHCSWQCDQSEHSITKAENALKWQFQESRLHPLRANGRSGLLFEQNRDNRAETYRTYSVRESPNCERTIWPKFWMIVCYIFY